MRHAYLRSIAAALAAALAAAHRPVTAQQPQAGASTGFNLLPQTLTLIESTRSGVAFEAVPDSRFRVVRHTATGFRCSFLPDSQALVTVVAAGEGARAGDDSVCLESVDGTDIAYRITRFRGRSLNQVFASAKQAGAGWFTGEPTEHEGAEILTRIPNRPDVDLNMRRQQALLVGETAQGPAMLRIAVVQLPDGWYVTQQYFAGLPAIEPEQQVQAAVLGSALAESALAIRLGQLVSPTRDPALARP
jgi:hypothetical protein